MSEGQKTLVAVAVPAPLYRSFDYLVPAPLRGKLAPGVRVRVPFGGRSVVAAAIGPVRSEPGSGYEYKSIEAVLDEEPLLPAELLELCRWAAGYYHQPLGEVIAAALPGPLREGRALRERDDPVESSPAPSAPALTPEQEQALAGLRRGEGFRVSLIEGVTGSGKTELYLQLAQDALAAGKQVLVLAPEIGLTPQLQERFAGRVAGRVDSFHSGMTEAQRARAWLRARNGESSVVVGTRSAVFLPFARLGLIVVDEEHDVSFKQQDGLRYHARDLAILRARALGIPVVLGSATPSLESLHNARSGRYTHLRLTRRVQVEAPPAVKILDVRACPLKHGLSQPLVERLRAHLGQGGQGLLFINRRGYAPVLLCHDCGWTAPCADCDARLTWHRSRERLLCHHCGATQPVPPACRNCGSVRLVPVGQGTERIEDALRNLLPQYRVERFDSDRMRKRGEWTRLIAEVRARKIHVLVGTQMLAKGHDFDGLSFVGILNVDQALYGGDFRALERMGQMVTQVAGRAGRAGQPGEVLLQTHEPDHPELRTLVSGGYPALCERLLPQRRAARLPPHGCLALLRAESRLEAAGMAFLGEARKLLDGTPLQLLGPAPAPMERRAGRLRAQLLLQSGSRSALQRALSVLVPKLAELPAARRVRWSVDVDPADLF